jgi:hypothetical protein
MARSARRLAIAALASTLALGCATYRPPAEYPQDFRARAETQTEGGVRVSAALLNEEEAKQIFATSVIAKEIQPIWIEIDNQDDDEYVLMLLSVDPDYFSPSEAASRTRGLGERGAPEKMEYFLEQHVPIILPPKSKSSGFVYANFDPGAKAFGVDLLGELNIRSFEFVIPVPGFRADFMSIEPESHYASEEIRELDLDELRGYLESLPCCVLGGDKKTDGDPMNLVIIGTGDQVLATLAKRGWDLTETITTGTSLRTAMSSLFGRRYRTSPVSPLYVFERPQDVALQKARKTVDERNHLRLWLAPVTHEGAPVWVGQISRDIGVKLSSKTIVTHKVDPVVDEARIYVLFDLVASGYVKRAGFVEGVGYTRPSDPRYNYTLDPYFTDGLRVVIILGEEARGLDEIDWLDWEQMPADVD